MKRFTRNLVTVLLCMAFVHFPVWAAQSGTAGIEFYYPPGVGPGTGGGGSSGGSSRRDTDPPRAPATRIELPDDEPILMVSPDKPLGRLPETGSQALPATALVLAGCALIAASRRQGQQTSAITVKSHG